VRRILPKLGGQMRARAGFTLIEVLASLLLIALIVPVALNGVSLAVALSASAKQQREATTLAASKLAELTATGTWQQGNASGDFAPDWPAYHWDLVVSGWQDPSVSSLQVRVIWTARAAEHSVTLTTLVPSGST
jgi:prepilin-type N-terminal cleavage/methylation domain-containing protein